MITKQAVLFYGNRIVARRDDVLDFLEAVFGNAKGIVCPNPFIHRPGQTRSSMLMEASEMGRIKRRLFMSQDGDSTSESDEEGNHEVTGGGGGGVTSSGVERGEGANTDGSGSSSSSGSYSSSDSSDEDEEAGGVQKKRSKNRPLKLPQVRD